MEKYKKRKMKLMTPAAIACIAIGAGCTSDNGIADYETEKASDPALSGSRIEVNQIDSPLALYMAGNEVISPRYTRPEPLRAANDVIITIE